MTELHYLTVAQLRQVVSIKEKIESLTVELNAIAGGGAGASQQGGRMKVKGMKTEAAPKKRRKMSAAWKAKLATAAKARWAKAKAAGKNRL